jgi:hypothetical protein
MLHVSKARMRVAYGHQPQESIAEWVRQALDLARRREPLGDVGKKLEVIRTAARYDYPSGDIDRMLAEIESGYGVGTRP